ncbi:LysR family transcriptional regulator [Aeromonas allosaccharophila]|uniref:LysR family transcriptional regulator n=1 Tax=Aeromonas allosaccharophila TaxID=656 RepID=UPI001F465C55|nr:LysR family transcriptional regulator [Aeromonas allosaccharophila]MCE9846527.1 LysR family transcriptional regulator [Aeromonas allosaccharophila]
MAEQDPFLSVRHFVAVAQSGSITAAALALGLTGSALSKSIVRLEARLGVKLLHRTTRRVSLTLEGEAYLASCLQAIQVLEETEQSFASGKQSPSGRVRIDLPAAFGRRHVLPILLELAGKHPQLDLSVSFNERKVDLIEANIDLVVRIGALEDQADLVARRLGEQQLVICGAPAYLARRGVPLTPDELSRHDCIIDWRSGHRHSWLLHNGAGKMEDYDIPVRYEMGDGEAVRAAALAGLGLVQVPTWLVREQLDAGSLVCVLNDQSGGEMPINVIWARSQHMPLKVRIVVDALLQGAQAHGSGFRAR